MLEIVKQNIEIPKEKVRERICAFEEFLNGQEGAIHGSAYGNEECPVRHTFVEGAYIREITMPKGMLLTSKIHKVKHPYFVMEGDCTVLTDEKVVRIKAPYWGVTQPMTKRVLYIWEQTVWCTVHVTDSKDVEEIEKQIILPRFDNIITYEDAEKIFLEG